MVAVMLTTGAPVSMQLALLVFGIVGIGLAAHENGWLAYLKSRWVIAVLTVLVLALVFSQTTQAAYYDTKYYCEWFFWDWWC